MSKKEKVKFKDWRITKFVGDHALNILDTVGVLLPITAPVVNIVRKVVKDDPMVLVEPINDTLIDDITPEGEYNKTKIVWIVAGTFLIINGITSHYFGFAIIPEEILKGLLKAGKDALIEQILTIFI